MCVACLNVSTQPCAHRWYQLVRSCRPTNHLANCPEKLKLQGWESRVETCPFCHETEEIVHESTHRLFGRNTNTATLNATSPLASTPPYPTTLPLTRHGSISSESSCNSSNNSTTEDEEHRRRRRGQRHRDMNARLHVYLTARPHEVLPSARKNYPSRPLPPTSAATAETLSEEDAEDDDDDNETIVSEQGSTRPSSLMASSSNAVATATAASGSALRRGGALLTGGWRKSVRLGRSVMS